MSSPPPSAVTVRSIDLSLPEDLRALETACAEEQSGDVEEGKVRWRDAPNGETGQSRRIRDTMRRIEQKQQLMWVAEQPVQTSDAPSNGKTEIIGWLGRSVLGDEHIDRNGRFTVLKTPGLGTDESNTEVKEELLKVATKQGSSPDTRFRSIRIYDTSLNAERLTRWCKKQGFERGTIPVITGRFFYKKVMHDETSGDTEWETAEQAFGFTFGEQPTGTLTSAPLLSGGGHPPLKIREMTRNEADRKLWSDASVSSVLQELQMDDQTRIHPDLIAKIRENINTSFVKFTSPSESSRLEHWAWVAENEGGEASQQPIGVVSLIVRRDLSGKTQTAIGPAYSDRKDSGQHVDSALEQHAMDMAPAGEVLIIVDDHDPQSSALLQRYTCEGITHARVRRSGIVHEPYGTTLLTFHKKSTI